MIYILSCTSLKSEIYTAYDMTGSDCILRHAYRWRKWTAIRVLRQRALQLWTYHFNTTSIKGKKTMLIHINREEIEIHPRTIMGWVPWMSYFQPDAWCYQMILKRQEYGQITVVLAANINPIIGTWKTKLWYV